jgi:hypothetical protein
MSTRRLLYSLLVGSAVKLTGGERMKKYTKPKVSKVGYQTVLRSLA